jgi:hypothetical protein
MGTQESLSLPHRFEPSHPSFPYPGHLIRLLGAIVLILFSTVDSLRDQFPMRYTIASQFFGCSIKACSMDYWLDTIDDLP